MIRLAATLAVLTGPGVAQDAPYAGQEGRDIAALSAADIAAIEAGEGWGLAKAAELNGHPGPAHLLENADALGLTAEQRGAIQAAFDAMNAEARALGAALIKAEARLDAAFEVGGLDDAELAALVAAAADARGRLRTRHLSAHLEVTPLLTRHQMGLYVRLRGYDDGEQSEHDDH